MQEHEFILNYARTNPGKFNNLASLCWQYIFNQARIHNVIPLLYNNIKNLPVPSNILKELEKIYTYTAFHNMLYLEELQKITEKIKNIIVLKGPALATAVYGNIGLRPFYDMDLLVKKDNLEIVKINLRDMGYFTQNENFYMKYHFHIPFFKPGKIPVHLEVHWAFVDKFIIHKIDLDKICDTTFSAEINLLYLLLHIEKHAFFNKAIYNTGNPRDWIFANPRGNQLIWYTDIYESINKFNINWQKLIDTAKDWCIENIVYYNLYIVNKLYPVPSLEKMPQPNIGLVKRLIYNLALKEMSFRLEKDMQLRPIRAIDLVNYLFPPANILKKYYCTNKHIPAIICYIFHFGIGIKEIFIEFLGICRQKLYTKNKKASPAGN